MQWLKSSLVFIAVLAQVSFAQTKFTSDECFNSTFSTDVKAQAQFFGLLQNELKLQKDKCLFTIKHKQVLETEWLIDVCREPIHMKVTSKGSQSVLKRLGSCERNSQNEFCDSWKELKTLIEDRGLIFAEGQREVLNSDHGKVYCSYLVLKKYLDEGNLFSSFDQNINIYGEKKESNTFKPSLVKPELISEPKKIDNSTLTTEPKQEGHF